MAGKGRGYGRGTELHSGPSLWEPTRSSVTMPPKGRGRGYSMPQQEGLVFENSQRSGPFGQDRGFGGGFGASSTTNNTAAEDDPWNWPITPGAGRTTAAVPSRGFDENNSGAAVASGGFNSGGNTFGGSGFGSGGFGSGGGFESSNRGFDSGGFGSGRGFDSSSRGFGAGGFSSSGFSSGTGGFGEGGASTSEKRAYGSSGFKKSTGGFGSEDPGYVKRKLEQPPIIKEFYIEDPEVTAMSDDEAAALRLALNNISVKDTNGDRKPPKPVKTFIQAFRAYPEILEQIEKQGFLQPTPIQCQMWPIALSGHDVIGIAQTGTGKTLGFLLPIFIHLDKQPGKRNGPGCIILTPTRELAQQIHHEVKKYRYKEMKSVCVYGGAGNRNNQIRACEEGVDIVIATPGRLQDLVSNDVIDLSTVTFAVLDEADRMLDMGFEPDIRMIMMDIRSDRQTILTSATWPDAVRNLATSYTKDPFLISVGSLDLSATHTVKQQVFILEHNDKKEFLVEFLFKMKANEKVIIFVATKRSVDYLANYLNGLGLKCQYMHGDRDQIDREKALKDLAKGHVRIMVATDVASRGLDISDITHVFNYDFPTNIEEYVHRVGRTGRAGKAGVSITCMTRNDWHLSTKLISIMVEANQEIPEDLMRLSEQYEEKKAELGAAAVDPAPRRRREDRENRRAARTNYAMFDPYTGEAL